MYGRNYYVKYIGDQKIYIIKAENQEVEVDRDLYIEYRKMDEHDMYWDEKWENNVDSLTKDDDDEESENTYDKDDHMDVNYDLEEIVEKMIDAKKLHSAIDQLFEDECELIKQIYFNFKTERSMAKKINSQQTTLNYRKLKILEKLRKMLEL